MTRTSNRTADRSTNFDKLARIYRWMEYLSFGPLLLHCRKQFLPQMQSAQRALILGDGDGRFTAALLGTNQNLQVHAIDSSPKMLIALLRATAENSSRVTTICADLRTWQPPAVEFDLVVSHFLLDCFSSQQVADLVARIQPNISIGAIWVVSEFAVPENKLVGALASILIRALYYAFGLLTGLPVRKLPDHASAFKKCGFELIIKKTRLFGILRSELWRFNATD